MSSKLVHALDQYSNRNLGENNCGQHDWSKESKEVLVQIYFQLVLSKQNNKAIEMYKDLLYKCFENYEENKDIIQYCYKLIAQTRDIIDGKGLYNLSYEMLGIWVELCYVKCNANPKNITQALTYFVENVNNHSFGSWKDLKYFANYCIENIPEINKDHEVIHVIAKMYGEQLAKECIYKNERTLVAKWAPREKSKKFGWLVPLIADYFCKSFAHLNLKCPTSKIQKLKLYRQMIGKMNKSLDTTQIKQCNQEWSSIDFNNVTSITMSKQSNAFLYKNKSSSDIDKHDRIICAENLKKYIEDMKNKLKQGKQGIKGKRVSIYEMIKKAIRFIGLDKSEIDILELQWLDNKTQNKNLENIIPMVDVSGSMTCDNGVPLYSAIGLGIRCSECSKIPNRVLTFSDTPSWVIYEEKDSLITKTDKIFRGDWGMTTNIEEAFKLILHASVKNHLSPDEISNLVLLILSDMQFNESIKDSIKIETMHENIEKMYHDMGMKIHGIPYTPPSIIFWNLRPTDGFPTLSTTRNVAMVSGNSPALLNAFVNKGSEFLKDINPWNMFLDIIKNERYNCMSLI